MFAVLKIVSYLFTPLSAILVLLLAGLVLIMRRRSAGSILMITGIVFLYGLSIDPLADALVHRLERAAPPLTAMPAHVDAIVVLGGGVRDRTWIGLGPELSELSSERVTEGVTLYQKLRVPIVFTGGSGEPIRSVTLIEADAMARTAMGLGVPERDIIRETASRNTVESARLVKGMLKGRRIVLVTSAMHMKRSAAMFSRQGFDVIPAPMGYRSEHRPLTLLSFIPRAGCLYASSNALAERLNYLWYAVRGEV